MKLRSICASIATLSLVSCAAAQNYDYFPRTSNGGYRPSYAPMSVRDRDYTHGCLCNDPGDDRYPSLRPANYSYAASWSPSAYSSPPYPVSAYSPPAYPQCTPSPLPPAPAYPGTAVGYPGNDHYVGYGVFGQPRAFARDEPVRNFFRFLLP